MYFFRVSSVFSRPTSARPCFYFLCFFYLPQVEKVPIPESIVYFIKEIPSTFRVTFYVYFTFFLTFYLCFTFFLLFTCTLCFSLHFLPVLYFLMRRYWNTRTDKFTHNIIGFGTPWFGHFRVVENEEVIFGRCRFFCGQSPANMMAPCRFLHLECTIDQ